jgi:hypothetical protein
MSDPNNKTNIPMGLDMNDFMPGGPSSNNKGPSGNKVPESKDPQIINDVLKNAPNFKLLMSTRVKNLNNISGIWDNAKNKTDSFEYINDLNDLGIINDVINFAFIKTELKYMDVRSKEILILFPAIIKMCKSKYDWYFKNGILTAWKILQYLGSVIIQAKQSQLLNPNNIDIAKEDKIKVYDNIIEYFQEIIQLDNFQSHLVSKSIEGLDLDRFISELNYFLRKCKGR